MAEFCTCGSLIIGGKCTNKRCKYKPESQAAGSSSKKAKNAASVTKTARSSSSRRASKCITYNLYDLKEKEESVD
mgnify:CR=1 FL=1